MAQKSVLIVGGGIIGLWSAYYLTKNGINVQIVDQGDFDRGCSYGNAGMIVPSHFKPIATPGMILMGLRWMFNPESPFSIKPRLNQELISWLWKFLKASTHSRVSSAMPVLKILNLASKHLYDQFSEKSEIEFDYQPIGSFMLCKTKHAFDEERKVAYEAQKLGLKAEVLTKDEVQSLDPNIELDVIGAVYFPQDAFLDPGKIMEALKEKLLSCGVAFNSLSNIHRIDQKDSLITAMYSQGRRFMADEYLIAAGAWSSTLLKELKLNVPMQAGKGYSVLLKESKVKPEVCSILTEARVAVTPMTRGLRIAGTMEIDGLDETVNRRRVKGIFNSVPKYFPQLRGYNFEQLDVWSGLRPCTPDGLPYIGRSKAFTNLNIATGHAMMGLSLGPISGKLISQIIMNQSPDSDISLLDPNRYHR